MQTALDARHIMADAKFFESYSRYSDELGRYENWDEAVDRIVGMHKGYYKDKLTPELLVDIDKAAESYHLKLVLGAQRALQFGGDQLLRNPMRMYNCTSSYCDRPEFFGEAFHILLCGAGVGFSVQKHHVAKLPAIMNRTKAPKIFTPDDSIEGWADCLDVLLSSYFENGGKHPEYKGHRVYFDLSKIRPRGSQISGGFKAPGPEPLRLALDRIEHLLQGIVLKKQAVQLAPIQAYDIVMHASDAVLAGGVRRSATICLFSPDDDDMLNAKTGNWGKENPQRARSNNSVVILRNQIKKADFMAIMEKIKQFGEPGFVFVNSTEHCFNPCVEIGMVPRHWETGKSGWQGCNLTEINGGACVDEETFLKACEAAAILGTLQAGYTNFQFIDDVSKAIFEREALIGVSITGWMANPDILFNEKILRKGAKLVLDTNKRIAKMIGINPAARATCVKPSGNASVLLKCPSGITPEHSPFFFRNVQLNKDTEVANLLLEQNPYMMEESTWSANKTDFMAWFPVIANKGAYFKDEIHGVRHLELVKIAQMNWVEYGTDEELCVDPTVRHNVSNTIDVGPDEWDEVAEFVFSNRKYFTGIAFMGARGDRAFYQAPFTKVTPPKSIVKKYGTGALFASGLVVDGLKSFDHIWAACDTANQRGIYQEKLTQEDATTAAKRDWIRRFTNYAKNYFGGDADQAENCLKDVHLLHAWEKIQNHFQDVDWSNALTKKRFVDIDTMGAAACMGVKENGEGACMI